MRRLFALFSILILLTMGFVSAHSGGSSERHSCPMHELNEEQHDMLHEQMHGLNEEEHEGAHNVMHSGDESWFERLIKILFGGY
jgi:hypothetical protein